MSFSTTHQRVPLPQAVPADALDEAAASSLALARDVLTGLSQAQKTLPCIWFYDHRGSQLFEDITRLPEYYPTRTEAAIFESDGAAMATQVPAGATLVGGSGSLVRTAAGPESEVRSASIAARASPKPSLGGTVLPSSAATASRAASRATIRQMSPHSLWMTTCSSRTRASQARRAAT